MSFLDHLDELRRRIIFAIVSLAVAFVLCFTFSTQIFEFLMGPMTMALPEGGELIATKVPEIFLLHLKMSFFIAIFIASPAWLTQVWPFHRPGALSDGKEIRRPLHLLWHLFLPARSGLQPLHGLSHRGKFSDDVR